MEKMDTLLINIVSRWLFENPANIKHDLTTILLTYGIVHVNQSSHHDNEFSKKLEKVLYARK